MPSTYQDYGTGRNGDDHVVLVHEHTAEIGLKFEITTKEKLEALYSIVASFHEENEMKYMLPDFRITGI